MSLSKLQNVQKNSTRGVKKEEIMFTHRRKVKITEMIENLKDKKDYIQLFNIIKRDSSNYTHNNNGVFINLNCLSDTTLLRMETFLKNSKKKKKKQENKANFINFLEKDDSINNCPRLSNYEKAIIKRHRDTTENSTDGILDSFSEDLSII